ncbi:MAG: hypothetical protein ACFFDT_38520, partial [Candidatus Hodarchaeota archaeon]
KKKISNLNEVLPKIQKETNIILDIISKQADKLQSTKESKFEKARKKAQQSSMKELKKHLESCQQLEKELMKISEQQTRKIKEDMKHPPKNLQDFIRKTRTRPFMAQWDKKEEKMKWPEKEKVFNSISLRVEHTQLDRLVGLSEVSKARAFGVFEQLDPSIADLAILLALSEPQASNIIQNATNLVVTKGHNFLREVYKQVEEYSRNLLRIFISQPLREITQIFLLEDMPVQTFQGQSSILIGKAPMNLLDSNQTMENLLGFPVLQQPLPDQKGWVQIFIPLYIHPPPDLQIQTLSQAIREVLISSFRRELEGVINFLNEAGEMFSKHASENITKYFDEITTALLF